MGVNKDEVLTDKVAARIKKIREQKGISQFQFLNDTGIHIARIESEQRDISLSTLKKVCSYFGMSMSEFLKGL